MTRTRRRIQAILPLIDAVVEMTDARVPVSSRNPELPDLIEGKPLILLLNKADMADPVATAKWVSCYAGQGIPAVPVDCKSGKGVAKFKDTVKAALSDRLEAYRQKGMAGRPLRVMIAGIPNVGKSSFINRIAGGSRAKVEDRPGVTRGNQWFVIEKGLELLDTPGVLWPRFDDPAVGERLAFTGAIRDRVLDMETLAMRLLEVLAADYPALLHDRYQVDPAGLQPYDLLEEIGRRRGMRIRGGEVDTERAAAMLLDEYRSGKLGRLTLEWPPENPAD